MSILTFDSDNYPGKIVCGTDEAGRGPLAGPVFAVAVILDPDIQIDGINDSKKLSARKRDELYEKIKTSALAYRIESVDEKIIDEINILNASLLAMKRAVLGLGIRPDIILVDGNKTTDFDNIPSRPIIKGDSLSASIAAASILAKVERDRFMLSLHEKYPQYGFDQHKGYPTAAHYNAILKYGISDVHRKTFLKNLSSKG